MLLATAPASGNKPEIVDQVRFDPTITELDPFLSDECGFPVTFSANGRFRSTIYFNSDGSFKRFVGHPSFWQTLSSERTSITTDEAASTRSARTRTARCRSLAPASTFASRRGVRDRPVAPSKRSGHG
jgi:hypothetical protein